MTTSLRSAIAELAADPAPAGRSARTIHGGRESAFRQTLMVFAAGSGLAAHADPGEATLLVLRGRVVVDAGDESVELDAGDLLDIPPHRHSVLAVTDAAILLTIAAPARE